MSNSIHFGPALLRRGKAVAFILAALPLAACATVDRTVPTSSVPSDYHLRHPVVLTDAPDYLDIFMVGASGRLDNRQARDIDVFATEYRRRGEGSIVIRVPRGAVNGEAVQRTLDEVRHALAASGVRGAVQIGSYAITDPSLASPLHLSYTRLTAKVASRCSDWPDDLNSGATLHGWDNRSYYNLGCASAQTLAAQIDDPRDVLRPRAEDPSDVQLRTRAIGLLRGTPGAEQGKDPGTVWSGATLSPISPVGGN